MTESNYLKQIGLALHNYASAYNGPLPVHAVGAKGMPLKNAKDKPLLSWRVALLPYLEHDNLYRQFKLDEPWDSRAQQEAHRADAEDLRATQAGQGRATPTSRWSIGPNALSPFDMRMPASFQDGTSQTVAVIEAAQPVIWTKPDDVMLTGKDLPKDLKKKFGGLHPGGFNVLMWDGSVRFVKDSVSETTLSRALNPRDGMVLGSDW